MILCQVKKTQSAKICLNFNIRGGRGVILCQVKTQSAKICLNFNGGEGATLPSQSQNSKCQDLPKFQFFGGGVILCQVKKNPKCQDLPKFQYSGGGGEGGDTLPSQNPKCQDLPKFQWGGEGARVLLCQVKVKTQSAKICLNFNFRGGGALFREWGTLRILNQIFNHYS